MTTRQVRVALSHLTGGAVGGAVTAAALWLLATPLRTLLPQPAVRAITVIVALIAFCSDLRLLRLPSVHRQLPRTWVHRFGESRLYLLYGAVLGTGLLTFAPYALTFAVLAYLSLQQSLSFAVGAGALMGLGRTVFVGPLSHPRVSARALAATLTGGYRYLPKLSATCCLVLAGMVVVSN